MAKKMVRTHVVLPKDLVERIDKLVGQQRRSQFLSEAIVEKLSRIALAEAAEEAAGSLAALDVPGWETSESARRWVRSLRTADAERLQRIQEQA